MAIELLAATTSAANSSPITVSRLFPNKESRPVTIFGDNIAGSEIGTLEISPDGGTTWISTGRELSAGTPYMILEAPGVYRIAKGSTVSACAIFAATPGNP